MCPGVICTQTCGNCECTWSGERRERLLRRFGAEEAQLPLISSFERLSTGDSTVDAIRFTQI